MQDFTCENTHIKLSEEVKFVPDMQNGVSAVNHIKRYVRKPSFCGIRHLKLHLQRKDRQLLYYQEVPSDSQSFPRMQLCSFSKLCKLKVSVLLLFNIQLFNILKEISKFPVEKQLVLGC